MGFVTRLVSRSEVQDLLNLVTRDGRPPRFLPGLRFSLWTAPIPPSFRDLRHQSMMEMAEAGVPEAAMHSIAGHLSRKMLDHYSHVRMMAKRQAVEALGGGFVARESQIGGKQAA